MPELFWTGQRSAWRVLMVVFMIGSKPTTLKLRRSQVSHFELRRESERHKRQSWLIDKTGNWFRRMIVIRRSQINHETFM